MTMKKLRWKLNNKRFTMKKHQGTGRHKECSTEIWTSSGFGKALATYNNHKNEEYPMILDGTLIPEIGNNNIRLSGVEGGMPIPQVTINGTPDYLHRMLKKKALKDNNGEGYVDHVNHNRFCILDDNLRIATPQQNGCNSISSLQEIHEANGKFFFNSSIFCGEDIIRNFKACGYTEIIINTINTGYHYMESKHFDTRKECAHEARRFNDWAYGKFSYHVENDFEDNMDDFKGGNIGKGTELLIRYEILGEFGKAELIRRNIKRLQGVMYKKTPLIDYI